MPRCGPCCTTGEGGILVGGKKQKRGGGRRLYPAGCIACGGGAVAFLRERYRTGRHGVALRWGARQTRHLRARQRPWVGEPRRCEGVGNMFFRWKGKVRCPCVLAAHNALARCLLPPSRPLIVNAHLYQMGGCLYFRCCLLHLSVALFAVFFARSEPSWPLRSPSKRSTRRLGAPAPTYRCRPPLAGDGRGDWPAGSDRCCQRPPPRPSPARGGTRVRGRGPTLRVSPSRPLPAAPVGRRGSAGRRPKGSSYGRSHRGPRRRLR